MNQPQSSIKTLFIISIVVVTGILLSIQTFMNIYSFKGAMEEQVNATLEAKSGEIAGALNQRLMEVAQKTSGLALTVNTMKSYDSDVMFDMADGYTLSDSLINGSGFWYDLNAFQSDIDYYGPYRYKDTDGKMKLTMDYSNAEYNYMSFGWYKDAKANPGKVVWEGPYLDEVSGVTMLTSAAAIVKNQPVGAVTVDISITELEDYIKSITVGDNGYAFLIGADGFYIATKDDSKNMKTKITEESNSELAKLGKEIVATSEPTLKESAIFGEDSYIMISPLSIDNIKLVVIAPKSDYDGAVNSIILQSIFMAVAVMGLLCFAMIYIFNKKIGDPIHHLMESAGRIANGDLRGSIDVSSTDEMGALADSLKYMVDHLKKIISSVNDMSEQVAESSRQLTESSEQSSQASDQIAISITNIAEGAAIQAQEATNIQTTAEKVTAHAQNISKNTKTVVQDAIGARDRIIAGRSAINDTVNQMQQITKSTDSILASIDKLTESGEKISKIVDMITSISEQTNLLALNAAIEAARAGEFGKGFAVVADEVRKLAEESNNSSRQILDLVKSNSADMQEAVNASNEGAESVQRGIETVKSADEVFQAIVDTINKLVDKINAIAQSIQNMATENEEMLNASVRINDKSTENSDETQTVSAATEQQSASVNEIADASRQLAELAESLKAEVNKFKL